MAIKKNFSSFEDLIANSKIPVLVTFYTTGCSYCQMLSPILEQVKTQMGDRLKIVKINTANYPKLASKYEVKVSPTTLLFVDGELASRIKGVMQAPQLMQYIQKFL
ncbi:thioredoxin fold domain-containing protein [Oscillatoriales cyanobacterium LEGE 11467]|uniref:Thioredoxin n=1 Tax=Zarconia navalis LEGE 11467 TaxID=1828826 RepID=A0A928VXY4_9CYAN|nr:thioredoxin family protein [Zarconia navalis]MBE9040306.1 thioredoxin fold domain-containing protein [Zarconia navalis LEGE 11467]